MGRKFGDLVRSARVERGMTQDALATAADMHVRTLIRIEGGANPSPETVMALSSVLGISRFEMSSHLAIDRQGKDRASVTMPEFFDAESDEARRALVETVRRTVDNARVIFATDIRADVQGNFDPGCVGPLWAAILTESQEGNVSEAGPRGLERLRNVVQASRCAHFNPFRRRPYPPYAWDEAIDFAWFLELMAGLLGNAFAMLVALHSMTAGVVVSACASACWFLLYVLRTRLARNAEAMDDHASVGDIGKRLSDVDARKMSVYVMTDTGIMTLRKCLGIRNELSLDARLIVDVVREPGGLPNFSTWKVTMVDGSVGMYCNVPDMQAVEDGFARLLGIGRRYTQAEDMALAS